LPWEKLYDMEAAFKPKVKNELDTQNFEKFEEVCQLTTILSQLLNFIVEFVLAT
jgi:hypothetical protein